MKPPDEKQTTISDLEEEIQQLRKEVNQIKRILREEKTLDE